MTHLICRNCVIPLTYERQWERGIQARQAVDMARWERGAGMPLSGLTVANRRAQDAGMTTEPEQSALVQIEGRDEDGCIWACSPSGRDVWCQNLGPKDKVVEVLSQWLASIHPEEA